MDFDENNSILASKSEDLSIRATKGGIWVFSIRVIEEILYLIKLVVLARILNPEDFGLFGVALLIFDVMKIFSRTGFESALIQKKENIHPYLDSAWTVSIIRGTLLFLALFTIAPVAAYYFNAPKATPLIQVIGIAMMIGGFTNTGFTIFDKELHFNKRFAYQITGATIDFVLTVSLAIILQSVWSIVIGMLSGHLVRCIMSYILHPYRPHISSDFGKAKELWNFGRWILISAIMIFLITEVDDFFVGIMLGVTTLGFYQMAYKISNLPATEITDVISQVTFPAYSKVQDDEIKLREGFLKTLKNTSFLTFFAGGLIFTFAFDFTKIFMGDKWIPMVIVLQILVIWGIIRSLGITAAPIFKSIGKPELIPKIQSIQFILMIVLLYPLTAQYNIVGTSFAIVMPSLIANWILLYLTTKKIKCPRWEFSKLIIFPFISTIFMILSIFFVKIQFNLPDWFQFQFSGMISALFDLGILVSIAIAVFFGFIILFEIFFNYNLIKEGVTLIKQILGKYTGMDENTTSNGEFNPIRTNNSDIFKKLQEKMKKIALKYINVGTYKIGLILYNYLQNLKMRALYNKYSRIIKNKPKTTKSIIFFPSGVLENLPSSRFRCYNMAKYLKTQGYFTIIISPKLGINYRKKILKNLNPDWVWVQKAYHPYNRYKYFKNYKVLFDLDDSDFGNIFIRKAIHEFFEKSQLITCGSEFIKKYAEKFSNNVYKIWTAFPVDKEKVFEVRPKKQLIIGWTPVNADEYYDSIKLLYGPLSNLHKKYKIKFRIISRNAQKTSKLFSNLGWVQIYKFLPYNVFVKKIKEIDIGIHPLIKNPLNIAKSFGKTLNYMNAGIPCVVSNIGENSIFFKDGINGFLANTPKDWEIKLEKLIVDADLRNKIANCAFKDMENQLSLKNISEKYIKLLFGLNS
ncbi:MAG: oligosaccharide flippase family protein [Candidatus Helarchaeota archaeon]